MPSVQNINVCNIIAYIFYGCLVVLNIIKLARVFLNSRRFSFPLIRQLDFFEHFKFLICFTASFAIFLLTFYFYTRNIARCPLTFPNYQYRFCECDLLERDFHKFLNIPEYELNRLCVDHLDNPDILYVDTVIQFSKYMQTRNTDKGKGMGYNRDQNFHKNVQVYKP